MLDQPATAKQVTELHDDEGEEEHVEQAQRNVELQCTRSNRRPGKSKLLRLHEAALLARRQEVTEESGGKPREEGHHEASRDARNGQGRHHRRQQLLEDGVGCHE